MNINSNNDAHVYSLQHYLSEPKSGKIIHLMRDGWIKNVTLINPKQQPLANHMVNPNPILRLSQE